MKKYNVTLYFHTYLTQIVEAENEEDAVSKARSQAECCTNAIIDCLQEEGNDVELADIDDQRLTLKQKEELGYES
jgi:hypothetical protein